MTVARLCDVCRQRPARHAFHLLARRQYAASIVFYCAGCWPTRPRRPVKEKVS